MTIERQVELGERCCIVLALLRDAGADDYASRLGVEAAEAMYHDLVHAVMRAMEEWRARTKREPVAAEAVTGEDLAAEEDEEPAF